MLEAAVTTGNRNALLSAPGLLYLFAGDRCPLFDFQTRRPARFRIYRLTICPFANCAQLSRSEVNDEYVSHTDCR